MRELKIFSGQANRPLAKAICSFLHLPLGEITLGKFPDGENFCKIEEDIRGRDVFLIQPTCPPVNDNIIELLIMIDSCKRASAERITTVVPYFGYARQDRKDAGRVPITAKLVANLIVEAGANRVLAMDLHAAQIQGFFDVPVDHLYAAPILDEYLASLELPRDQVVVISPDEGSIKRSLHHQERLGGQLCIVDKRRSSATETKQANLIGGPIKGKIALLFDDMITTAGSIVGAVNVVHSHQASRIYVGATHPVFCGKATSLLREAPIHEVVVTNSVPISEKQMFPNLKIVSCAPLLGEAIKRIHRNESVSYLFD